MAPEPEDGRVSWGRTLLARYGESQQARAQSWVRSVVQELLLQGEWWAGSLYNSPVPRPHHPRAGLDPARWNSSLNGTPLTSPQPLKPVTFTKLTMTGGDFLIKKCCDQSAGLALNNISCSWHLSQCAVVVCLLCQVFFFLVSFP